MNEIHSVLITGGAGNLARVVADELRGRYAVTLFDRVPPSAARAPWETDLPFVMGDLTNLGDCMRAIAFAQADAVVHLGAIPHASELSRAMGPRGMQQHLPEDETMRVNAMGTFYVTDAARRLGVKKLAMASTFFVLGCDFPISDRPFQVHYLPIDENHPLEPESTYGLSKICGEQILAAFQRAYGIKTAAFRLLGVQYEHRPTHKFAERPPARPGYVGGPKMTTWQYVDARDVAQAFRLFLEVDGFDQFEAFFLATDTKLEEETAVVLKRCCPDLADMADVLKGHEGIISIRKAQQMLGYQPKYSWRNAPAAAASS